MTSNQTLMPLRKAQTSDRLCDSQLFQTFKLCCLLFRSQNDDKLIDLVSQSPDNDPKNTFCQKSINPRLSFDNIKSVTLISNSFICNNMLNQSQENKKFAVVLSSSKENLATDRSLPGDDRYMGTPQIAPWSGDEYYSKIKQLIKTDNQRKRSETSTAFKSKISFGKQKIYVPKIRNVELQVSSMRLANQWSRTLPKKSSNKLSAKNISIVEKLVENQKSSKVCPTVNVSNEVNIIHFRKSSLRQFPQSRMKTQKNQEQQQQRIKKWHQDKYKLDKGKDKQSRMFFFQTKNSSNVSNRQKMIMKIRNIEKGRVERVYTQAY